MKRFIIALSVLTAGCLDIDTATMPQDLADKVEIDPAGKTKCDTNGNNDCSGAAENKDKCPDKEGKYSGTCWCTHCEGGNICENETDHMAHDEKCKLKAAES
jgi:hypothetical protein